MLVFFWDLLSHEKIYINSTNVLQKQVLPKLPMNDIILIGSVKKSSLYLWPKSFAIVYLSTREKEKELTRRFDKLENL